MMPIFNVTFKFKKLPWYTITNVYAIDKTVALRIAGRQMILECGTGHKMLKPVVEMTGSIENEN